MTRRRGAPTQDELDRAIRPATSLRVREVATGTVLLEVDDPDAVTALSAALTIAPGSPFHCMCDGDQDLVFAGPAGPRARLTLHHGRSLRWAEVWDTDVLLADPEPVHEWLAARGVTQPGDEFRRGLDQARHDRARWAAWAGAAPECLRAELEELSSHAGIPLDVPDPAYDRALERLRSAYPDPGGSIRALLGWFGSGEGPWSGYPTYETVAERLLMSFPTAAIVAAFEEAEPMDAQLEGAARLFASWWFGRSRPGEASELPRGLRRALLAHLSGSAYPDNRDRLRLALGADAS